MKSNKGSLCAVYPGSFDPITKGHIDLVKRLSVFFKPLVVLVSTSSNKQYLFSLKERLKLVKECLKDLKNVKVTSYKGLTIEYMKEQSIQVIIRGVRTASDFDYELTVAAANKKLFPDCETFIVFTRPEYRYLSSQVVKEIALYDKSKKLNDWIPLPVQKALKDKSKKKLTKKETKNAF